MDLPKGKITCAGHPISRFGAAPSHPHEKLGDGSSCCGSDAASAGILPTWKRPGDMLLLSNQYHPRELPWLLPLCTWHDEVSRTRYQREELPLHHIQGRRE